MSNARAEGRFQQVARAGSTRSRVVDPPARLFVSSLLLLGLVIPGAEVHVLIGGAKFTVGRLFIALLLVPAFSLLCRPERRFFACDYLMAGVAVSMIFAGFIAGDSVSISSSISQMIEMGGGYLVARAYFYGNRSVRSFLSALKGALVIVLIYAIVDKMADRSIVHNSFAALMHVEPFIDQYRSGGVRAAASLDHAIHFGLFCSIAMTVFLFGEQTMHSRGLWTLAALFGCILAWSSSGLMASMMAFGLYGYGRVMQRHPSRWRFVSIAICMTLAIFFLVSNNPMGWIMSHLTLDAASGYIRFVEWDFATQKISEAPWTGYGFQTLDQGLLDLSVDCVWLVQALRYGLPSAVLLGLAVLAAMLQKVPADNSRKGRQSELRTGFTIALGLFMFVGFTAHFWNYIWIFWSLCIGLRVSIGEYAIASGRRHPATRSEQAGPSLALGAPFDARRSGLSGAGGVVLLGQTRRYGDSAAEGVTPTSSAINPLRPLKI